MKKLLLITLLLGSYLFGAMNVQTASKAELMSISGIGEKKADAIIKYRKKHKLKSADDLVKVPGIGKNIANNVKHNVKSKKKKANNSKKSMHKKQKNMSKKATKNMNNMKKQKAHKNSMKKKQKKMSKKSVKNNRI